MAGQSARSRTAKDSPLTRQDYLDILHSAIVEYEQAGGKVDVYQSAPFGGSIVVLRGVDVTALDNYGRFTLTAQPT